MDVIPGTAERPHDFAPSGPRRQAAGLDASDQRLANRHPGSPHLIHIKAAPADMVHFTAMKSDQKAAAEFLRKAQEYRERARATADPRVRPALEAVAREFMRKARDLDASCPRLADIQ